MGHMTPLNDSRDVGGPVSYLPHHGVLRESSTTTKLRVVFNGSTATSSGDSLNRHLLVGPNLLPPLADVLLRWRVHRFVLATDIEKMYRQIMVHPEDRDLQRIVWRYNPQDELREYRLNTVTYGLACAPFLAMRVLRQLADDEETRYPLGAAVIRRDVYMDDVLTGADSLTDARELLHQLVNLCVAGGFPLRKWSANDMRLMDDVPAEHRMNGELRDWRPHEAHSTLGLRRDRTFRAISHGTLFDPLGWLAPVVVSAKIAFQATWRRGLGWDEPLDEASTRSWLKYQAALPLLEEIQIPRWIGPVSTGHIEIHGFCDASELAYAAVTYLRTEHSGSWRTRLIAAKMMVAPIKQISLPRLELCAATLLARLVSYVRSTLDLVGAPVHLWSDSTVALGWIQDHPSRWHTFVANRVAEIQTTVASAWWHHVPGRENPADCASRGLSTGDLINFQLRWRGPPWLEYNVSEWPTAAGSNPRVDLPEERIRVHATEVVAAAPEEAEELLRFSSLHRLLRVTAWCRRWVLRRGSGVGPVHPALPLPLEGTLSVGELEAARLVWVRAVQMFHYPAEMRAVELSRALSKSSKLIRLSPFLDAQGILHVGGRLGHAVLSYDE
ncbi:PREDICTED: uncharacterized protein LOC105556600 [Vollenhovia emeryi]|uniref:uncharacterized protein LOC105556600 n=1 Tax=Vollenhovia emeryi TaxID=411798 RepID=UPI0005F5477D|nr:PREDICTED: uncharacterized protein LOC105556600 [Vollenhovia emeryi]